MTQPSWHIGSNMWLPLLAAMLVVPAAAQWKSLPNKDFVGADVASACRIGPALGFTANAELCQSMCLKRQGVIITYYRDTGGCFCKCDRGWRIVDSASADSYAYLPSVPALGSPSSTPLPSASPTPNMTRPCLSAVVPEMTSQVVSCQSGKVISAIEFVSYGRPRQLPLGSSSSIDSGSSCNIPTYVEGTCHATSSRIIVEKLCLGKPRCRLPATTSIFGDPCPGKGKRLVMQAVCNATASALLPAGPSLTPSPSAMPTPVAKEIRCGPGTSITSVNSSGVVLISSPRSLDFSNPVNLDCAWSITAPSGHIVALSSIAFAATTNRDFVSVFDGATVVAKPLVYLQSTLKNGAVLPPVFSSGRSLYVRFQSSDYRGGSRGLIAAPVFLPQTPASNSYITLPPALPPAAGSFRCSPGVSQGLVDRTGAVILTNPSTVGSNTPYSIDCSILIRSPFDQVVALTFLNMSLTADDFLTVFEGETPSSGGLLLTLTATSKPVTPVISRRSSLLFRLESSNLTPQQLTRGIVAVVSFLSPPKPLSDGNTASTSTLNQANGWASANMQATPSPRVTPSASMVPKVVKTILRVTLRITGPPNWNAGAFLRSPVAREALVNTTGSLLNMASNLITIVSASVRPAPAASVAASSVSALPFAYQPNQAVDAFAVLSAALLEANSPVNTAPTASSQPSSSSSSLSVIVGAGDTLVVVVGISLLSADKYDNKPYAGDPDLSAAILGTGNYSSAAVLGKRRARRRRLQSADPAGDITKAVNEGNFLTLYAGFLGKYLGDAEAAVLLQQQMVDDALASGTSLSVDFSSAYNSPASDPSLQAFRATLQSGEVVVAVENIDTAPGPGADPDSTVPLAAVAAAIAAGVFVIAGVICTVVSIKNKNASFAKERAGNGGSKTGRSVRAINLVGIGGITRTQSGRVVDEEENIPVSQLPASVVATRIGLAATSMNAAKFADTYSGSSAYADTVYRNPKPSQGGGASGGGGNNPLQKAPSGRYPPPPNAASMKTGGAGAGRGAAYAPKAGVQAANGSYSVDFYASPRAGASAARRGNPTSSSGSPGSH